MQASYTLLINTLNRRAPRLELLLIMQGPRAVRQSRLSPAFSFVSLKTITQGKGTKSRARRRAYVWSSDALEVIDVCGKIIHARVELFILVTQSTDSAFQVYFRQITSKRPPAYSTFVWKCPSWFRFLPLVFY